jgi:hypothetical protein
MFRKDCLTGNCDNCGFAKKLQRQFLLCPVGGDEKISVHVFEEVGAIFRTR